MPVLPSVQLDMFDAVDVDQNGLISEAEFVELLGTEGADRGLKPIGIELPPAREASAAAAGMAAPQSVMGLIIEHAEAKSANLTYLFHRYDKTSSGGLEQAELQQAVRELGLELGKKEMRQLMRELGKDGRGFISIKDFSDWCAATTSLLSRLPATR